MWIVANRGAFERSVAQAFPNGEWLAKVVVDKFQADLHMLQQEWSSKYLRVDHVWQCGKVVVRYRFLPGVRLVEVLSVEAERIAGQTWGRVDIFLVAVLVVIFGALLLMTFTL